jgi:hypothetical protein
MVYVMFPESDKEAVSPVAHRHGCPPSAYAAGVRIATGGLGVYSPPIRTGSVSPPDIFPFVLRTAIPDVSNVAFAGAANEFVDGFCGS